MVIKFLPQFVQRVLNNRMKKENIARPNHTGAPLRVAVDADALLYYVYLLHVDFSFGGENEKLYDDVVNYLTKLVKCGFEPCVFISGTDETAEVEMERGQARVDATYDLCNNTIAFTPSKLIKSTRGFRFHPSTRQVLIQAIRSVPEVKYQVCPGSVFPYVVSYATTMKCPVIAYESTYLVTDIQTYIHCDSLNINRIEKDSDEIPSATASVVRLTRFAEKIGMPMADIRFASRFLPSDTIPQSALQAWRDSLKEGRILSNTPGDDMPALKTVDSVFTYVKDQLAAGKTKEEIVEDVVNAEMALRSSAEAVENASPQSPIVANTAEELHALLAKFDDLFILRDHRNTISSFDDVKTLNPSEENCKAVLELEKWIPMFVKQGKIPSWVYTVVIRNFAAFPVAIEETRTNFPGSLSGAAIAARPLRAMVYGLLGLKDPVQEQLRRGPKWVSESVNPMKPEELVARGLPSTLKGITAVKAEERRRYILAALLGKQPELIDSFIADFKDDSEMFIAACLAFMFSRPISNFNTPQEDCIPQYPVEYAAGLISSVLMPQATQPQKLIKDELLFRDLQVLHMGAIWQYVIDAALAINGLLGFCFNVKLEKAYSGPCLLAACKNEEETRTKSSSLMRKYSRSLCGQNEIIVPQKVIDYNNGKVKTDDGFQIVVTNTELMFANYAPSLEKMRVVLKNAIRANANAVPAYKLLTDGSYTSRDEDAIKKHEAIQAFNAANQSKFASLQRED